MVLYRITAAGDNQPMHDAGLTGYGANASSPVAGPRMQPAIMGGADEGRLP